MNGTVAEHDERTAELVAQTLAPVLELVEEWRSDVASCFEELAGAATVPTAAALDPFMEVRARPALEAVDGLVTGAGFVATPGVLADAPWHLAWWLREVQALDRGGVRRLEAVSDPAADQFRDYRQLEWWRGPERTGRQYITGPYVDYLCTDDYTVTVTSPVSIGGRMIGMVGADVHVSRLERVLLPILRGADGACTIVNASKRVIASSDSHRATGSLLRGDDVQLALATLQEGDATSVTIAGTRVVQCGDLPLFLVFHG